MKVLLGCDQRDNKATQTSPGPSCLPLPAGYKHDHVATFLNSNYERSPVVLQRKSFPSARRATCLQTASGRVVSAHLGARANETKHDEHFTYPYSP